MNSRKIEKFTYSYKQSGFILGNPLPQEEGEDPNNRLSKFAKLLRDKGGLFSEALLEAKEGTLLAPSNEALERADKARLDHVLGSDYLRAEMLGLHFVRDKIISSDYKIRVGGDQVGDDLFHT